MRLQHVGLTVPAGALPLVRPFYAGVLGLPELGVTERALIYDLGSAGGLELHVIAGGEPDEDAEHHFALEVDDLDAVRSRVTAAGYLAEEARPVGGRERFFVRDPVGNLLELVTPRSA